jgi:PIN domain nuclease of toxin-antitoxin system
MRLLLDTHAFLWWITDDQALSRKAREAIGDEGNECLVSVASLWEIAIKSSLGRLELGGPFERVIPDELSRNGFAVLGLTVEHLGEVAKLPHHHGDPFDRVLAAQAIAEELPVVSRDAVLARYGARRVW